MIGSLVSDLKFGFRMLRKNPVFTLVAIVTLALGIGGSIAVFSVVNAVLLRPLPYQDDTGLVVILQHGQNPVSPANFQAWRDQARSFQSMGAAEAWSANLTGSGTPEKLEALHITPEILPMLGVKPQVGRWFLPQEDQPGSDHEVVLSHGLWKSHFAGDFGIVGQAIRLGGEEYTVVGVMPPGFRFAPFWATKAQLWAPLDLSARAMDRNGASLRVFARLNPGVDLQQARAEMAGITARLEKEFPGTNDDMRVVPLRDKVVGNVRPALLMLFGAVAFVLLIACANVAHMLMARAAARQRQLAIRVALGARRIDILRQLLAESLVLAFAGGGAGLLLATWGIAAISSLGRTTIPRLESVNIDSRVLFFALGVSLFTGLAFGLAPGLKAFGIKLSDSLKDGERGVSEGRGRNRLRGILVGSEFAFAVILLTGAALMIRSFVALQNVDPGFDPHHVLSLVVNVAGAEQGAGSRPGPFYQQVLETTAALPGVESVSAINHLPLAGDQWGFSFHVEGQPLERPGESPVATFRAVLPGYFHTMRIPLLRGRDVTPADDLDAPGVVVINDFMARRYWPGQDPIGKRIRVGGQRAPYVTVVGVAKDTVRGDWVSPPAEEIFLPLLQERQFLQSPSAPFAYLTLVVRTQGDPAAMSATLRSAIHSIAPNAPVSEVQTMEQVVVEATRESHFYLVLLAVFASVAYLLAAVGIYGVMSYSVSLRTREFGIRIALGAGSAEVLKMVISLGLLLAGSGIIVGLAGALLLTRFMSGLLYQTTPTDAGSFFAAMIGLTLVALLASYIPARRAARVDPMVALRYE